MQTIIETQQLSKSYGSRLSVNQVDLRVPAGSIYGFLGPNGAGKSTTMKMILGLVKPTFGHIFVLGREMNEGNRLDILKNTGSLIESPSYYGHLSGRENLEIICMLKGLPKKEAGKVLETVRLQGQQDKKVRDYSLGMKQRLGLACALLGNPRLLLLDEPTNGLDPAGIQEMRELICSLPRTRKITVLISSHLLSEIDQMADWVGIINHGELIFQDTMENLHEHSRKTILMKTLDDAEACRQLKARHISCRQTEEGITFPSVENDRLAILVTGLVQNGVPVYRIEEHQKNLEDIFLSLTGRSVSL